MEYRRTVRAAMAVAALFFLGAAAADSQTLPRVRANDNRAQSGRIANGVLTARLEAREGTWYPEGQGGPGFTIEAFGEEGRPPRSPGPVLRMPVGTTARISVHNRLPRPMALRGLGGRAAPDTAAVVLAPGERREFTFTASVPGTFYYWGRTRDDRRGLGIFEDGQLLGAMIVDAVPPPPGERLLVVQLWADRTDTLTERHTFLVNGLSWPHTERLQATVGDTLSWRVINASVAPHPMHLHGFYFLTRSRGTAWTDSLFAPAEHRLVVTEFMRPGETMSLAWRPSRPGNWLFHCHFIRHVESSQHLGPPHAQWRHNHALGVMAGLITGIEVRPRPGDAAEVPPEPARRLRMYATERPGAFGDRPAYSFIVREGEEPARDSIRIPGTPLLLRRDEPVAITVINRTRVGVTVHWHGIELVSLYDGVPGWSGDRSGVAPLIAAEDSFTVHLTPDRAGTFIYHTHADEAEQLASGLYGPLIVLAPGETWDPERDRIFLAGWGGPGRTAPPWLNGTATPDTVLLRAGEEYRLRFINITPSNNQRVRLLQGREGAAVTSWRRYAKDGARLPEAQARVVPASQPIGAGETYDFTFRAELPAVYTLEIITDIRGQGPVTMRVPVIVTAAAAR